LICVQAMVGSRSKIAKLARYVVAVDIDPALLEVGRHRLVENNAEIVISSWATRTTLRNFGRGLSISLSWRSTVFLIVRDWSVQ
jgi:hypothetical protein